MPELDVFEARLTEAVHSFAGRAETRVDAAAVAERTVRRRGIGSLGRLGRLLPVPVSILLLLALLLAMLAWSIGAGAPWSNRAVVLVPVPTATAAVTPAASPTPTPVPSTTGTGDQYVVGTESGVFLVTDYTSTKVGDVTQMRGGTTSSVMTMNDRRVTGTMTYVNSLDVHANVGSEWGTGRLVNDGGTWEGNCTGMAWEAGNRAAGSCSLVGTGGYTGYLYYFQHTYGAAGLNVQGFILPGSAAQR